MSVHNLYKQEVYLDEKTHQYFNNEGEEYVSFSKIYGLLVPKFDAEGVAVHVAKKEGTTQEAVLAKWKGATNEGTRIDKALELYAQTSQILAEDADLEPLIKYVMVKYKDYNKCYQQLVVYNNKYKTAGSLDKIGILSNRSDSKFHLSDFKCFENGMGYVPKGQAWLNYPFDYLPNTKYTKINFQTSYYTWHLEQLTGRKCERIFADMIKPIKKEGKVTGYSNTIIPMPYIKPQIELLLETYKNQILSLLEDGKLQPAF